MAPIKVKEMFRSTNEIYSRWKNGYAKQTYNVEILQQDPQGNSQPG